MNRVLAAVAAICAAVVLCSGIARADDSLAVTNGSINASSQHEAFTELMPIEVSSAPDKLEIRKVYELDPNVDPGLLPRDGFERGGVVYACADILREVVIGEESKIVTATETADSKRNDMDTILTLLPQSKEFIDEDGFVGTLRLNAATIRAVEGEYGKKESAYTVSRTYPNLSEPEAGAIPKAIDDGGKTLTLKDLQWHTDGANGVDGYELGSRYTAVAIYGGTRTSSYVKNYTVTADYTGEVSRKGVTAIRYTVIFIGEETTPAADGTDVDRLQSPPSSDVSTAAESPEAPPDGNQKSGANWLPTVICVLALLGCGACLFFTLKGHELLPWVKNKEGQHARRRFERRRRPRRRRGRRITGFLPYRPRLL